MRILNNDKGGVINLAQSGIEPLTAYAILKEYLPEHWAHKLLLFLVRLAATIYAVNIALKCFSPNSYLKKVGIVIIVGLFTETFLLPPHYKN